MGGDGMAKRKIDWEAVKREYIYGYIENNRRIYPTYRDLAERHNITLKALGSRAKRDNWTVEKEMACNRISQKVSEKQEEMLIDEHLKFSKNCFSIAQAALKILGKKLIDEENNTLRFDTQTTELRRIMETTQIVQNIGLKALEGTSSQKSSIDELVGMFKEYWNDNVV